MLQVPLSKTHIKSGIFRAGRRCSNFQTQQRVTTQTMQQMTPRSLSGNGIIGSYTGTNLAFQAIIVALGTIALYNVAELGLLILFTFKKYHGLYFWSLVVSTVGVAPYTIGFLLKFLDICPIKVLYLVLVTIGWWTMVTGQSVVLYSRLHIVVWNQRTLTVVRTMIIINAFILHIPTTVLTFFVNIASDPKHYTTAFNVMEKIQMTGFCLQEFVLSILYLKHTYEILHTISAERTRKNVRQLIYINIIIILLDCALLGLEYANMYILEAMVKGVVYSVKLKLEFMVLGKLVQVIGQGGRRRLTVTETQPTPVLKSSSKVGVAPVDDVQHLESVVSDGSTDDHGISRSRGTASSTFDEGGKGYITFDYAFHNSK